MSDAWYYADGSEPVGPVPHKQLRKFLLSPRGGRNTLVWRKGFSNWKAAREVGELNTVFGLPPPAPRQVAEPAAIPTASSLARDPEKARPGLDPGWEPVFGKDHAQSKELERDGDSKKSHPAMATKPVKTPRANESFGKKALRIVATLFGAALGSYGIKVFGGSLLWPAALIGVTWFILAKCKVESVAVPMLAFVVGHTGWMIVGSVTLFAMGLRTDLSVLVDIVIVIALSIWFLWARSRAAAIAVLIYQILALVGGASDWGEVTIPGANSEKLMLAQTMHIILRVVGIGLCIYAISKLRKKPAEAQLSEVFE